MLKAKTEIFKYLQKDGHIVLNGDDDKLCTVKEYEGIKPVFFGMEADKDVFADEITSRYLKISVFAFSTPSLSPRFSRWQVPILVITQVFGLAIFARRVISPKSLIPISRTAIFKYLQKDGHIVLNGDDDKLCMVKEYEGIKPVFFGMEAERMYMQTRLQAEA